MKLFNQEVLRVMLLDKTTHDLWQTPQDLVGEIKPILLPTALSGRRR